MQITITANNLEVNDWLRGRVERKVGRLSRYLPTMGEVLVELSAVNAKSAEDRQVAELTLRVGGIILRAEDRSEDILTSLDRVTDKMYRQIARYKGKRWDKGRRPREEVEYGEEALLAEYEEEPVRRIVRRKRFPISPMTEQEAIEQMELLGHDFFLFYNVEDEALNVLYRRKDGDYGLIQPDMA